MTGKVTATPVQNGRFVRVMFLGSSTFPDLTRLEATELRDALTRALRKTRNPR